MFLVYTWLCGELGHVKIETRLRDLRFESVMCDLEGAPSMFRLIRKAAAMVRTGPTFDLSCEENAARRKLFITRRKLKVHWQAAALYFLFVFFSFSKQQVGDLVRDEDKRPKEVGLPTALVLLFGRGSVSAGYTSQVELQ
jgi:hypothetical protein